MATRRSRAVTETTSAVVAPAVTMSVISKPTGDADSELPIAAADALASADQLIETLSAYLPACDAALVRRAYDFAQLHHTGQTRKSGEPYFAHPVAVAGLALKLRLDDASVCAGLLHDVVEDTPVTVADIEREFGVEIAEIVDGVTKLDKIEFTHKEDKQAENFRKMIVAMSRDIRVLLIKLADRLHNMQTLAHMRPDQQKRISRETIEIYAPLANRLGINWMKSQLEDLCFRYLYPEDYQSLKQKVGQAKSEREAHIARVVRRLQVLVAEAGLPQALVSGRPKHLFGIYRKMQRQDLPYEQIYDAQGFRVIVETVEECYRALGVVHTHFTPIPGRFKDYIALAKDNNYQSLHTAVMGPDNLQVEIQIRTVDMNRIADYGVAAHWRYKESGRALSIRDEKRFTWLKQLLEWNHAVSDNDEFLDNMKIDLFADEVYTFTPLGEVKIYPRGATPVDFAYSVHTRVGERATGAKVNGVMVPLSYRLRNGDTVEILTRSDGRPSQDWLEFVATARAKTKIRNYIRAEQRKRALGVGA